MKFTVLKTECVSDQSTGTTTYTMEVILKAGPINLGHPVIQKLLADLGFSPLGVIKVRGIAHLKPQDTWDETFGRRVAEAKCHRKMFSKMTILNVGIIETVEADYQGSSEYVGDIDKYFNALQGELVHLANLCND